MLLDEGGRAFRISGTGHTVVAAWNDDQLGFDAKGFKLLMQVPGVLDRDDHVVVTMNLHDRWVVFAGERNWRNIFDQLRRKFGGGCAGFVADQLTVRRMPMVDAT